MGNAIEKLTGLVKAEHRYDIPFAELRDTQIEAMNERFQARKDAIKLLGHRAGEAKIDTIRSHAEAVPLLLPPTAYKSYPESWLMDERWDRLGQGLERSGERRVGKAGVRTGKNR